jgi:hypothetical protein
MIRAVAFVLVLAFGWISGPAGAQIIPPVPDLQSRIPAPLPPPPEPPIINGPYQQAPPPGVIIPPRINTFGDRVTRCTQQGAEARLRGGRLSRYTRACANDH